MGRPARGLLKAIKQPALVVNGNDRRRWFGARRRSRIF
jgi:hypothetical protein